MALDLIGKYKPAKTRLFVLVIRSHGDNNDINDINDNVEKHRHSQKNSFCSYLEWFSIYTGSLPTIRPLHFRITNINS